MKSYPVSDARNSLADVLGELDYGPVEITRHGKAVGYIVSPTMFHNLPRPTVTHVFSTPGVEPATASIEDLVAIEPLPAKGDGPTLSEALEDQRADRL